MVGGFQDWRGITPRGDPRPEGLNPEITTETIVISFL